MYQYQEREHDSCWVRAHDEWRQPMFVTVRGTSGSGKSTVMRRVMDSIGAWDKHYVPNRKQPLYLRASNPHSLDILVLGHYEIACGGCDTLGSAPDVYNVIQDLCLGSRIALDRTVILGEGLLLSEDVKWTVALEEQSIAAGCPPGQRTRNLFLTTPLDECLRRVEMRQEEKGKGPSDPERVIRKLTRRIETIESARRRLLEAGIHTQRCSSDQAVGVILRWLRQVS